MDIVAEIRRILADAERVYVFGSYADQTYDQYSDLDLLIVKETDKDFFYRYQEIPDLYNLGLPVDLLIYTPGEFAAMKAEGNPFIEHILENGTRII